MATRFDRELFRAPLLREPTLHFALLAGALFLAAAAVNRSKGDVIEIDRATVEATVAQVESSRDGAPLGAEERAAVEQVVIQQEILAKEAVARGLDQGDPRIRDILAQKMLHVLSADVIQPTEGELSAYYEANRERYQSARTMTVDEIVIPASGPLPPALEQQLREGVPVEALVSDLPLNTKHLPQASLEDLTLVFGPETATLISGAEPGRWVGPHQSVRGQHWFRIVKDAGSRLSPLDEVREQVRLDWIAEQENVRLQRRVTELTDRYSVVFKGEGSN